MNQISEFLTSEYEINLEGGLLIIAIFSIIFVLGGLILATVVLYRRLQEAKRPKFGFLGKPLYQFLFVSILAAGAIFTIYTASVNTPNIDDSRADEEIQVEFSYRILETFQNDLRVQFTLIPLINGEEWGDLGDEFDIYVSIDGDDDFTETFDDVTELEGAQFEKLLSTGEYDITITIVTDTDSKEFTETIIL